MDSFPRASREGETREEYFASLQKLVAQSVAREFPELMLPLEPIRPFIGGTSAHQPEQERYKKTGGAADGAGENYEWKMLTLVFLRLLAAGYDFKLASNMADAGLFDDIVLRWRKHFSDPWKVAYLQLKHKKNRNISKPALLGISGDFSLLKYCASYASVRLSEEKQFVIFTNGSVNETLINVRESDQLLGTGGKAVSFKAGSEVYLQLCEWVDFKEILTELHGPVDGMCGKEVGIRVKDAFNSVVYRNKAVMSFKEYLLKIPTWAKLSELRKNLEPVNDKETYSLFLGELLVYTDQAYESELAAKIKEELAKIWKCGNNREAEVMLHTLKDNVKTWWQKESVYLTQDSPLWLDVIKSQTEALSKTTIERLTKIGAEFEENCLKILHDVISCNGISNVSVDARTSASSLKVRQALAMFGARNLNVLHVNMKALLAREDNVLSAWATRWCRVLVVECDDEIGRKYVTRISARVLQVVGWENEKLLVLIAPEIHELHVQLYHSESYKRFSDNFAWSDLTERSRDRFLSCRVFLNGVRSPQNLSELLGVDKHFVNKADLEVISQLLQGDLACGKDLDVDSAFFVTRRLQDSADNVPFAVNSVRDVPGKVVLIVAEPGMGKSTLITHLAKSAKAEDTSAWIVHIKLNNCAQWTVEQQGLG